PPIFISRESVLNIAKVQVPGNEVPSLSTETSQSALKDCNSLRLWGKGIDTTFSSGIAMESTLVVVFGVVGVVVSGAFADEQSTKSKFPNNKGTIKTCFSVNLVIINVVVKV
ncbi:MAG: hypothetical protein JNJ85_12835, partial [Candidatus Kapabacteria bacterium]|nr:hypothetical protein [Candidatus Kapabacteria bacterium]